MKWWVYVLLSSHGKYYVGSTVDILRRTKQHNGEIAGGAKCTRSGRPWSPVMIYGPYFSRSEVLRAEYALKKGKRGSGRIKWSIKDSQYCRLTEESQKILEFVTSISAQQLLNS